MAQAAPPAIHNTSATAIDSSPRARNPADDRALAQAPLPSWPAKRPENAENRPPCARTAATTAPSSGTLVAVAKILQ